MDVGFGNKSQEAAIREEYRRIDEKWLKMQCQLMLFLLALTAVGEAFMYVALRALQVEFASTGVYFAKYLLVPLAANGVLCFGAFRALKSAMPNIEKAYAVSLLMTVMAFVVYTVHSVFPAMFAVFIIPMLATVIYGEQKLTAAVAAGCIFGKVVSDLFLFWDPGRKGVLYNTDSTIDFGLSLVLLAIFYGICAVMILAWNRQALRQMFQRMEEEREEMRFFLAMLDMDDFKNLNDTYGHSQGDRYLKSLGQVLLDLSGEQMVPFRFGGDEFCVIFCGCDQERVRSACRAIQECFIRTEVNQSHKAVSVSIGVAEFRKKEPPAQLLDRADAALYRAKQNKGSICFEL